MEGLHICITEKVRDGVLHGASLGNPLISISHLFYADDAIFVCKWHRENLEAILQFLDTFHTTSGFAINMEKSVLYGLGVVDNDLDTMVNIARCAKGTTHFAYLGLQMGASMNQVSNWNGFIEKFKKKLSGWQANLLSTGGRATLVKSVLGSMSIYYLSLYKCPETVINEIENIRASFFRVARMTNEGCIGFVGIKF
ncbi:uncharacterized protein [Rutidosis leptorrhynchoides]|uniref:uncharacterized protein n=1 Tax=Rutidosis leptorrhynchoides TaxID=125765 RepID=UPI003A98E86F